jgi:hypothetical protein
LLKDVLHPNRFTFPVFAVVTVLHNAK